MANLLLDRRHEVAHDPYFYGWRDIEVRRADGSREVRRIPLTEFDILHPEEDYVMGQLWEHLIVCHYLLDVIMRALNNRLDCFLSGDQQIDWQVPNLGAHMPDFVVFEGLREPWTGRSGTFRVKDLGIRPLVIVELTSPSTRNNDLKDKVKHYHKASVPLYVIVDLQYEIDGVCSPRMLGYEWTPKRYRPGPVDAVRGVWVESLSMWIGLSEGKVMCRDQEGTPILSSAAAFLRETAQVKEEATRANLEAANALKEKKRADEADARIRELEAELLRRGGT